MARYRKIDPRIWNDEKFRTLSDSGKLAFLFVLTHPHMTSLGAMRGTVMGLAEELKASRKPSGKPSGSLPGSLPGSLSEGFREAIGKGLLEVDEDACYIGAKNFLRYNGPESPNVVRSWETAIDLIPECKLKVQLMQRVRVYTESLSEGFGKALPKAFAKAYRKASPNQEQEQEQEQEKEQEKRKATPLSPNGDMTATRFFELYQTVAKSKGLAVPADLTDERRKKINTRLKTEGWIERFREAIGHMPIPNTERFTWQPDIDWLIANGTNVVKLAEGSYDRKQPDADGPAEGCDHYD